MFCAYCGTKLLENARFCQNCGSRVIAYAPTSQSTPTPKNHGNSGSRDDILDNILVFDTQEEMQQFYVEHPLLAEIRTKVVGISYRNDDGTSRQAIVARCKRGDQVIFRPYTYDGEPALAVLTEHGQIGNLSANLAADFEYVYEDDLILAGTISEITGGVRGQYYGCNLFIRVYKA